MYLSFRDLSPSIGRVKTMTNIILTGLSIIWTWIAWAAITFTAKILQDTYSQLKMSTLPLLTELAVKITTGFVPLSVAVAGTIFLLFLYLKITKEDVRSLAQNVYLGFLILYTNLTFIAFLMPFWIPTVRIE